MALITLDPDSIFEYTPKFDRKNTVDPFKVHLKYCSNGDWNDYKSKMILEGAKAENEEKRNLIMHAHQIRFYQKYIVGFENWTKADGTPGKAKNAADVEEFVNMNDVSLIEEIEAVIKDSAFLSKQQRKN